MSQEPPSPIVELSGVGKRYGEGPLDADELRRSEALVRSAIEQGALGVSSGLIYVPSRYAGVAELAPVEA